MKYWKVWSLMICFVLFWVAYVFLLLNPGHDPRIPLLGVIATLALMAAMGLFLGSILVDVIDAIIARRRKK